MAVHISTRLAWHMDGWNGHICSNPAANTYCVGQYSYPGTMIAENRDLDWEESHKGMSCTKVNGMPPCMYSINAFGSEEIEAYADTPQFFKERDTKRWTMLPSSICIWPYEQMYSDEVKTAEGRYDYDARLKGAQEFFSEIAENQSLIFYYSNYSNPFSEEDQRRYVIVGMSRVKEKGEILSYDNISQETRDRYAGGFIWQYRLTSHYPDQGLRIPYHNYLDRPDILEQILLVPDNPRNFKYAARHISDDDALALVERSLEIASNLKEIGDTSENWSAKIEWLQSLIAELWKNRGLYPGLPKVLDHIGFREAIPVIKSQVIAGKEQSAYDSVFAYLKGRAKGMDGLEIPDDRSKAVQRQWKLKTSDEANLLECILPRFDLSVDQITRVLSPNKADNGVYSSLPDIAANPYILCEQFVGDNLDDTIPFSKIDHGVFPSPDLSSQALAEKDDWRRLRALCVEKLRQENKHTFVSAQRIIHDVNHRLSFLPEWKRYQFTERYLEIDREELQEALAFRESGGKEFLYLKAVFEDERAVEKQIRSLASRPDITFRSPVTDQHWHSYLNDPESDLAKRNPEEYLAAIKTQADICQKIFVRPVCVLSGAAGTGKTTVINAVINAIEKAHGAGTSFCLLAPTGKAADRIREKTGKRTSTIHSFLAEHGWLNDNYTLKRVGGRKQEGYSTYIIDEASMLDLSLVAALFRSINWASVQRLILVGDPNQLPPIGCGRVFADIVDWLQTSSKESIGVLETNIRHMENRLNGKGTGILDLASIYVRKCPGAQSEDDAFAEYILRRVQEGGDIDKDLRVIYWNDANDLQQKLLDTIITDMELDSGQTLDESNPQRLWRAAFEGGRDKRRPEYQQTISPYRSDPFGTEALNEVIQRRANGKTLQEKGNLGGITLFDKVIQVVNRPKSNPVWAYNTSARKGEKIEVFNGEIGFVNPDLRDCRKDKSNKAAWMHRTFRVKRFQIVFSRKPEHRVNVDSKGFVEENLELGYAISVHKSQGSEFDRVYFILPKHKKALLSREMFYTGVTRARCHCTILAEEDICPFLSMRRPESSHLVGINSSLFEFRPLPDEMLNIRDWYEEGKIHRTLADIMVRSKSEVIIANMLFDREIPFRYEVPLFAPDGTFYLPDFTIKWGGEDWYWEHVGMMDTDEYRNHWETKYAWYDKFFPGRLITTYESGELSIEAKAAIEKHFGL